jgi:hypothetical protein
MCHAQVVFSLGQTFFFFFFRRGGGGGETKVLLQAKKYIPGVDKESLT